MYITQHLIVLLQPILLPVIICAAEVTDFKSGCVQLSVSTILYDLIFQNSLTSPSSLRCRVSCSSFHSYYHVESLSCGCWDVGYQTNDAGGVVITKCSKVQGLVIQRRIDDSVSFARSWQDYVSGFGDPEGNYWIGLETMHQISTATNMSLEIYVEPVSYESFYIYYDTFMVEDASTDYRLILQGQGPRADILTQDSLMFHGHGSKFTTSDRINSVYNRDCNSRRITGGWWFYTCADVYNLNGEYTTDSINQNGIKIPYIATATGGLFRPIQKVIMSLWPA